jgi:excisionase family DNA binding protein
MSDQLLTVREVAHQCRRSEETVRRWIWSGKLPARKLGNQLFISVDDVSPLGHQDTEPTRESRRRYTRDELLHLLEEDQELSLETLATYGPIDVAGLVRQVREGA